VLTHDVLLHVLFLQHLNFLL